MIKLIAEVTEQQETYGYGRIGVMFYEHHRSSPHAFLGANNCPTSHNHNIMMHSEKLEPLIRSLYERLYGS